MNNKDEIKVGIVGAGPVGLTLAARLGTFGIKAIVFDKLPYLLEKGSKACLIQGDALEILNKIGCANNIAYEGVAWRIAHTYAKDTEIITQEFAERVGFAQFTNISQYRIEQELLTFINQQGLSEVKWNHEVISIKQVNSKVEVLVSTPLGSQEYYFDYLIACDGVRSKIRELSGLNFDGYTHKDQFLITDIKVNLPLTKERHFHFSPSFHSGKQLVIHPQPDNIWRIDWQLESNANIEEEKVNGKLKKRIARVVGNIPYEIKWISTYKFNQKVINKFKVGNIFFAGDAAHSFPPYGSRGMNSGIEDAENLAWKLAFVILGVSNAKLLETYHLERHEAALENLKVTAATMSFIAPSTLLAKCYTYFIVQLSRKFKFMRRFINHGKMAEPFTYKSSSIIDKKSNAPLIGKLCPDAKIFIGNTKTRLRELLNKNNFTLLLFCALKDIVKVKAIFSKLSFKINYSRVIVLPRGEEIVEGLDNVVIANYDDILTYQQFYRWEVNVFVVRPDGYIAIQQDSQSLMQIDEIIKKCAYFELSF